MTTNKHSSPEGAQSWIATLVTTRTGVGQSIFRGRTAHGAGGSNRNRPTRGAGEGPQREQGPFPSRERALFQEIAEGKGPLLLGLQRERLVAVLSDLREKSVTLGRIAAASAGTTRGRR